MDDNSTPEFADMAVVNSKTYTVDLSRRWADAFAVKDGVIIGVGTEADISKLIGPQTEIVDAEGRLVLPGIIDAHTHCYEGARAELFELQLPPNVNVDTMLESVRVARESRKPGSWIVGGAWSSALAPQLSSRDALAAYDRATGDHPTVLRELSYHARYANSAAMRLAGIDRSTPDPDNGTIVRAADGTPTGLLLEAACGLIDSTVPPYTLNDQMAAARHAVAKYNGFGVTGFTHAVTSEATMRIFKELDDAGDLRAWIATCIATESLITPQRDGIGDGVVARRDSYASRHVAIDFVKYFMDGVPATRTAAFMDPYVAEDGGPGPLVQPFHAVQQLTDLIAPLDAQGIHVKVHAIGDKAIHDVLDAIENVRKQNGRNGPQHQIAHLSHILPDDIPRLSELNVMADLCPPLWFPNATIARNRAVLGQERADRSWPVRSLLKAGTHVCIGTDWPALAPSPNPWPGMSALITRENPEGIVSGQLGPDQAIDLAAAIPLYTLNPAISMGFGELTGSIAVGKFADFIILDRNLFEIPPRAISETRVLQTYFAGKRVYASDER
ncbi:amidohydrolase [Bradyrhizobium sp.]|uniref:amidohydrolase n=1 Tax=Bradyrhizobium sp. TaxID=376 RepID=UPI0039E4F3B7